MFSQIDTLNLTPETTGLKYDAASSGPRRRAVYVSSKSEDRELPVNDRQALISQGRDLMRNLALVGFAVRKHLQYVAKFSFKCSIPNQPEYSRLVEQWMYNWSCKENCDLARRHCLSELLKLIETHRVLDGDVGIIKHANGRLQLIEGDRIRNPPGHVDQDYEWVHGVKVGKTGQAFKYAISKRLPSGGFEHEREVQADNLILCGYYNRTDQVRGVPPLAPAIMTFQHVYEGVDYALAKAKLCQLLGLLTTTEDDDGGLSPEDQDQEAVDTMTIRSRATADAPSLSPIAGGTNFKIASETLSETNRTFFVVRTVPGRSGSRPETVNKARWTVSGTSSLETPHLNIVRMYPIRSLTILRQSRSDSIIASRTALSLSGENSATGSAA